jgi:hypothetical protein
MSGRLSRQRMDPSVGRRVQRARDEHAQRRLPLLSPITGGRGSVPHPAAVAGEEARRRLAVALAMHLQPLGASFGKAAMAELQPEAWERARTAEMHRAASGTDRGERQSAGGFEKGLRMGKATKEKKLGYDEAAAELPKLDAQLVRAAADYSSHYEAALVAYRQIQRVMAESGAMLAHLRQRRTRLLALVEAGPTDSAIERSQVQNPHSAEEQVLHEKAMAADGVASSDLIEVDRNMAILIGGLFRVRSRTELQTLAAARYRDVYERAQLGGAKAIDYSVTRVDSSGSAQAAIADMGVTVRALGPFKSSLVERVVCDGMSIREVARRVEGNEGDAARQRITGHLLLALDEAAELLGVGQGRRRGQLQGSGAQVHVDWRGIAAGQRANAA